MTRMTLSSKLILSFLSVIVALILSITLFANFTLRRQMTEDKAQGYRSMARQLALSSRLIGRNIEQALFDLYDNAGLAKSLGSGEDDIYKRLDVEAKLRYLSYSSKYFFSMAAVDLQGSRYFGTSILDESFSRMDRLLDEEAVPLKESFTAWFSDRDGNVFLKKDVYTTAQLKHTGILIAHVDADLLRSMLGMDAPFEGMTALCGSGGRMILSSGGITQGLVDSVSGNGIPLSDRVSVKLPLGGREHWLTVEPSGSGGFSVVHLVPVDEMLALVTKVSRGSLFVSLAAAGLSILLSLLISRLLLNNFRQLHGAVFDISTGNFDVPIPLRSNDEVGQLAEQFRFLQGKLKELTKEMVRRATESKQAEYDVLELKYRSLQSQVSPHFICNILSSIHSLAVMNRTRELCELAISASAYLRDNLRSVEEKFTLLGDELASVERYIALFRGISRQKFDFVTDVDEEAKNCFVPSLILQPLVENSIVHGGLNTDAEHHQITLEAKVAGDRLLIFVFDNGRGVDPEVLDRVTRALNEHEFNKHLKGFGLRGVLQRLRLLYADGHSFSIVSELTKGTRISIEIPVMTTSEP